MSSDGGWLNDAVDNLSTFGKTNTTVQTPSEGTSTKVNGVRVITAESGEKVITDAKGVHLVTNVNGAKEITTADGVKLITTVNGAKTITRNGTKAAQTTTETTKQHIGIALSFVIKFQNVNPVPPNQSPGTRC